MKNLSIISKKVEIEFEALMDLDEQGFVPRLKSKTTTITFFGIPVYRSQIKNKS